MATSSLTLDTGVLTLVRDVAASNSRELIAKRNIITVMPTKFQSKADYTETPPWLYRYDTMTIITIYLRDGSKLSIELQDLSNQPTWNGGTLADMNQAISDIKDWMPGIAPPEITISTESLSFADTTVTLNSASQTFTVSGVNLTDDITVTPPTGFKISLTNGSFASTPLVLNETGGTVASTTIYVVLSPTAVQAYTGDIACTSTDATTKNVAVDGDGVLDSSAQAVVNRMTSLGSTPSASRQLKMNALVLNLKGQGVYGSTNVWNKLDILQPYYAETAIQSLVEWKMKDGAGVYDATAINAPTFTANSGYGVVLATNKFIKTNFAPSQGTNYTLNSASFGGMYSAVIGANYISGINIGTETCWIRQNSTDNTGISQQRLNSNTNPTGHFGLVSQDSGMWLLNRNSSTEFKTIKNTTVHSTMTQATTGLSTNSFGANGMMDSATTISNAGTTIIVKVWIAGGDLESDRTQLYNSLLAYIS